MWVDGKGPASVEHVLNTNGDSVEIYGLFIGKGVEKRRLNIRVCHRARNTKSRVVVRGVLFGKAEVEFHGNVDIVRGARGTDAHLEGKAILLSPHAKTRLEPYLEIDENDVKATHSTYAGPLDESEIFYVRTRGLAERDAKRLLVQGFFNAVLENIETNKRAEALSILANIKEI